MEHQCGFHVVGYLGRRGRRYRVGQWYDFCVASVAGWGVKMSKFEEHSGHFNPVFQSAIFAVAVAVFTHSLIRQFSPSFNWVLLYHFVNMVPAHHRFFAQYGPEWIYHAC
jgi:hypothetical protein